MSQNRRVGDAANGSQDRIVPCPDRLQTCPTFWLRPTAAQASGLRDFRLQLESRCVFAPLRRIPTLSRVPDESAASLPPNDASLGGEDSVAQNKNMGFGRHLVRVGTLGQVGRFDSVDKTGYARHCRVICRTSRGLEIGEVLAACSDRRETDGDLVRPVAPEDELLLARIQRRQTEAFRACANLVASRGLPVVLMDVEHLFDGQSLYFYFLGEITAEVESLTNELAAVYEAKVQFRKFTQTLIDGCGPDCGSETAAGSCGAEGCSSCALSGACGPRR